ncbi:MAG: hypothetical protein CL405_01695 [Acidimicrobiaceae bacterium]|nr:hypothetical protein [Acidimicrobiaceae bacterium]
MATFTGLGDGGRLDEQEAVWAGHLCLLPGGGLVARDGLGRRCVLVLLVVVAGGDPVAQDGIQVSLDVVGIGLVVLVLPIATYHTWPLLILILVRVFPVLVVGTFHLFLDFSLEVGVLRSLIFEVGVLRSLGFQVGAIILDGLQVLGLFLFAHFFLVSAVLVAAGS